MGGVLPDELWDGIERLEERIKELKQALEDSSRLLAACAMNASQNADVCSSAVERQIADNDEALKRGEE